MLSSFLMYFHSYRIDNVLQTLRFMERNHPEVVADSELILLCQDRIGKIPSGFASTHTVSLNLPNMQKCKAINHGARMATADKLVLLDSDRILPSGYFRSVLFGLKLRTVVSTRITHKLREMAPDAHIIRDDFRYYINDRKPVDTPYALTVFSGNAALYTEDYWRAGGMNEDYIGYGFEDSDMSCRLKRAGVEAVLRDEVELHLYHRGDTYGEGDQKHMFLTNGLKFCRDWRVPIPPQLQQELNEYTKGLI